MDYKEIIKEKGLKKRWIADKIGVSRVLFSYYINGTRSMPESVEKQLKAILTK